TDRRLDIERQAERIGVGAENANDAFEGSTFETELAEACIGIEDVVGEDLGWRRLTGRRVAIGVGVSEVEIAGELEETGDAVRDFSPCLQGGEISLAPAFSQGPPLLAFPLASRQKIRRINEAEQRFVRRCRCHCRETQSYCCHAE